MECAAARKSQLRPPCAMHALALVQGPAGAEQPLLTMTVPVYRDDISGTLNVFGYAAVIPAGLPPWPKRRRQRACVNTALPQPGVHATSPLPPIPCAAAPQCASRAASPLWSTCGTI